MRRYMKAAFSFAAVFLALSSAASECVVVSGNGRILMENSLVSREFSTVEGFRTRSFGPKKTCRNYSSGESGEFLVSIDGTGYDGRNFDFAGYSVSESAEGKKLEVELTGKDSTDGVDVRLEYWIFDGFPAIRKRLQLINRTGRPLRLENLDVESLHLVPVDVYMTNIYANYGTNITRIPYVGNCYDPAVLVYNEIHKEGIILGNEAPGVLKRTSCYEKDFNIGIGMNRSGEDYPFRTVLDPGETFVSPGTFIIFSARDKWQDCLEIDLGDYVRKYLGVKLFQRESFPQSFYCTWIPFMTDISAPLVKDIADNLSGTGTDVLIIDDGWYDRLGDYNSNPEKFPDGIRDVCRHIRSKGLIPGLWFSVATISRDSRIFRAHPEWAMTDSGGNPVNLHDFDDSKVTMSLCSPWYDYIREKIRNYVRTCGLGYVKLDFAMAASAYRTDVAASGDYTPRSCHEDRESSYWSLYQAASRLFDELKAEFPELVVDCTFELWGKYHLVDYALLQHADVDWLTNYEFPAPEGPVSIRQINYERSRVIPVQTMMVGNQLIDSNMWKFTFQSLASGVRLVCGDPRNLSDEQKSWYRTMSEWLERMEDDYKYSRFAYRSDIFGRPSMSGWDGCYRFNPERQGGVLFFYRNGSPDDVGIFPLLMVEEDAVYRLTCPDGSEFGTFTGDELLTSGIRIHIGEKFGARLLEIRKICVY